MKVITDQGVYGDEQGATRECTAEEAEDDTLCAMVEVVTDVDGDAINTILLEILQSEVNSAVVRLACPGQGHGETKQVLDGGINAVKDVSTIPNFPSAVSGCFRSLDPKKVRFANVSCVPEEPFTRTSSYRTPDTVYSYALRM